MIRSGSPGQSSNCHRAVNHRQPDPASAIGTSAPATATISLVASRPASSSAPRHGGSAVDAVGASSANEANRRASANDHDSLCRVHPA